MASPKPDSPRHDVPPAVMTQLSSEIAREVKQACSTLIRLKVKAPCRGESFPNVPLVVLLTWHWMFQKFLEHRPRLFKEVRGSFEVKLMMSNCYFKLAPVMF